MSRFRTLAAQIIVHSVKVKSVLSYLALDFCETLNGYESKKIEPVGIITQVVITWEGLHTGKNADLFKVINHNIETNRAYNPTLEEWLFCNANKAEALIASTSPAHVTELSEWSSLTSVAEVK